MGTYVIYEHNGRNNVCNGLTSAAPNWTNLYFMRITVTFVLNKQTFFLFHLQIYDFSLPSKKVATESALCASKFMNDSPMICIIHISIVFDSNKFIKIKWLDLKISANAHFFFKWVDINHLLYEFFFTYLDKKEHHNGFCFYKCCRFFEYSSDIFFNAIKTFIHYFKIAWNNITLFLAITKLIILNNEQRKSSAFIELEYCWDNCKAFYGVCKEWIECNSYARHFVILLSININHFVFFLCWYVKNEHQCNKDLIKNVRKGLHWENQQRLFT